MFQNGIISLVTKRSMARTANEGQHSRQRASDESIRGEALVYFGVVRIPNWKKGGEMSRVIVVPVIFGKIA